MDFSILAKYLLFRASDGYDVIFLPPKIDPEFTEKQVMLAFQMDGKPLPFRYWVFWGYCSVR